MRVLGFRNKISQRTMEELLDKLRSEPIPAKVLVDSPGGEFTFFSVLGPAIARQGLTTIAVDVRSAAIILFLLGYHRQALQEATFFFHDIRAILRNGTELTLTTLEGMEEYLEKVRGQKRENYQEIVRSMRTAQEWFVDFIVDHSRVSRSTLLNLMRSEAKISAREALHYGIVHRIVREEEILH